MRLSGAGAQFNQLNGLQNNQGTLQVDSGASFTNTVQLNNTGVLNVGIQNNNASGTLINSGTLNNNRGGTLNINSGATMINNTGGMLSNDWGLNISGGGTLTNAGTLINNQGGFTVAQTAIVNGTGSITQMSGGTLTIDGSVSQNNIAINGGELTGTGHITTTNGLTVSAGGTVNPGDFNPGTLTVNGNASFSGGTLDIHINNATQFGALIASEAANFTQGGNIVISNGNNPASSFVGDSFAVLSAGTISNNVLNAITFNGFGNLIETETLTFNPTDTIETLNITFTSASITLPVPASAWLFSSIVAGFIGFNRRRPV